MEQLLANQYAGWIIVEQDIVADRVAPGAPVRSATASRSYLRERYGI